MHLPLSVFQNRMWVHVSVILSICTASAFDLFPNQDKVLVGSVSVELLWESTPGPGGRDRRSAPVLPGQLAFQFSMGGERVELNLKRNPDLNTHTPAFVVRGGQVMSDSQYGESDTKDAMGYYQDVSKAAAIMVKREVRDQAQYELMGTYIMAEEQYTIQPLRVDHGDRSGQRVANHSIARLMTHLSLRNDILDFVRDPATEDMAAGNKKSATDEPPAARRRYKRQATVNRVELLIVTDYAVYATWFERTKGSSQAERRSRALENMKQYYAFVINGIDLRYASIKETDFRIDVTFAGIVMIDDPQESLWTVNLAGAQDGGGEFVESSDALESFRSWVLNNETSFPPNDHVMLFTGYNLTYGGSTANAGLAYIKSMCNPEFSISIVEEFFEFRIIAIAAHELGHSLGARHDMDGNKCFAFFLYIMTSRFRFPSRSKATNPWRFSKCSIDYFRKYIATLNSNSTNCMLTQDASTDINEIAGFLGDQPGQVYSPDKQCEVRFQSEDSHVCRDGHNDRYTNICSQGLLCRVPGGGGACERIVPADGTPCDKGKWCMGGSCVASTDMVEWTDGCPFGDTPGVVRGTETCQDLVIADPRVCYNDTVRLKCCDACVTINTGITGCSYGDRQRDCQADLCPSYTFDIQNVSCCATCHNFFNPTTPTTPGPSTTSPTTTPLVPLTVSLLTTPADGDVTRGSTGVFLASSGPFESMGDISTKSEKLMKSELMPTSEIPVTMTTRDEVMTKEQPRVYTSTVSAQGQTPRSTDETAFQGVPVSSQSSPGSSKDESSMFPTTASVPASDMATLTHLVTSPRTLRKQPTPMNTLQQMATRTVSFTESPNSGPHSGGVPRSNIGDSKQMTRKRKLAKLRQLREFHLRQRQAAVRRQWLYYYTLLTRSRHNWRWGTTGWPYVRGGRQRLGRLHRQTFSWEHSMEEMENDEDTDVGVGDEVGGRERRSAGAATVRPFVGVDNPVQSYVGDVLEGGRTSRRQPVTAGDNVGSDREIRHDTDTKAVVLDTHGLDADTYDSRRNGLNDEVSTHKNANPEKETGSSCQDMCNSKSHIIIMNPLTTDHKQVTPSSGRGRHGGIDDGGASATAAHYASDEPPINTVPMITVPLFPSVPSLKHVSDSSDYDEVTSTFTPTQSITDIGVTMTTWDPRSDVGRESIRFTSKPTFLQTKPVTARDKLQDVSVNPFREGMHINTLPSSVKDITGSSNYKLSSPSSSGSSTAPPDFLLLHKPRSGSTRQSWVNGVRLKYNVIDVSKNTEGEDHETWIFHAMINPGMIPMQTRLINLQEKRRHRMMPFDGEIERGNSKGERNPTLHRQETARPVAEKESVHINSMSNVDKNSYGNLRPGLSANEDTRGLMKEVMSSKGEDTQPNVRNVQRTDARVFNTIVWGQNQGETILVSHGREDSANLGEGSRVVFDHPPSAVHHTSRDNSDESSKDMYIMEDAEDDSFEDLEEEHPPAASLGSTVGLGSLPEADQLAESHQPQEIMPRYRKWDSHVGTLRRNWVLKENTDAREVGNGDRGEDRVGRGAKPTGDLIP